MIIFFNLHIKGFRNKGMSKKITEQSSLYDHLETMSTLELLSNINKEDAKVAKAVKASEQSIAQLIDVVHDKMSKGGRLFYIGAGTSGRLGVLDASECPPTFGIPEGLVVGIVAGGDKALRVPVEFAEDSLEAAWNDLCTFGINTKDFVLGIAASGSTPYVVHGLEQCRIKGITTGSLVCNPNSRLNEYSDYPIEVIVGPEFLSGSTRMKAGTAQKMILNMISTSVMIKLGRVKGNRMVDMMLSNDKLIQRGTAMVVELFGIAKEEAQSLLVEHGSVRKVFDFLSELEKKG
jgi:N-acetylmuramic acid 6-phosphate etherase